MEISSIMAASRKSCFVVATYGSTVFSAFANATLYMLRLAALITKLDAAAKSCFDVSCTTKLCMQPKLCYRWLKSLLNRNSTK